MSAIRLSILTALLALLTGSISALPAFAEVGDHVVTTDRLNLRECPATSNCAVLRTLPRGTHLEVGERQGEWLRVRFAESEETGWVHEGFTQAEESTSARGLLPSVLMQNNLLMKLFVLLSVIGALLTMASFGRTIRPNATRGQLFALSSLSVLTGVIFLLNQFGPVLAKLAEPWLSLKELSFLWEVNAVAEDVSYGKVALFLGAMILGVAAIAPGANGARLSFFQGACTGFLGLPVLTIATLLVGLVLYLLSWVLKALLYVLGLIAIPFIWLFEHLVVPVLQWLAIPFIWLWENLLREILLFLAPPFVWLWEVLLQPLAAIFSKFVLKPILFLILGIAVALFGLFPFAVIGIVALDTVRNSLHGSLNSDGLFSQGVTAGFLLLDAAILASLSGLDVLQTAPPLSLTIPVALQLILFLRLLTSSEAKAVSETSPAFQQKLATYWNSSQLELISTCVMIPLSLLGAFAGEGDS